MGYEINNINTQDFSVSSIKYHLDYLQQSLGKVEFYLHYTPSFIDLMLRKAEYLIYNFQKKYVKSMF